MDVANFRVTKEDWVLVLAEERQEETAGGIFLPVETGLEKVSHGTGRIIGVPNRGKVVKATGLKAGDRIAYRDYLKVAQPLPNLEGYWPTGTKKHYFMMNAADVDATMDEDASVWVLNRPAMTSQELTDKFTSQPHEGFTL